MKRLQPQQSSSGLIKRGSRAAVSELSQSMMDLGVHKTDTNDVPVPRFKTPVSVYIYHISLFMFKKRRSNGEEVLTKEEFIGYKDFARQLTEGKALYSLPKENKITPKTHFSFLTSAGIKSRRLLWSYLFGFEGPACASTPQQLNKLNDVCSGLRRNHSNLITTIYLVESSFSENCPKLWINLSNRDIFLKRCCFLTFRM